MTEFALIFPGQGSQSVGMGHELADEFPEARAVFEEVDDALGEKLSTLMFEGPEDKLVLTSNTQPALMAVSVAATRVLEARFGVGVAKAKFVAGHSLGEYSALAAAGAISLTDTARLLRKRGDAMQAAVPAGEGAMAALLGADMEQAEAACAAARSLGPCDIANDNAPGQLVISGAKAAVEAAADHARGAGVKKAVMLAVSAPFHCDLMRPAADAMADALNAVTIKSPVVPLVANVTASTCADPDQIRSQLVEQVTGRVRWRESVHFMVAQGVETMAEAGSGKVLTVMNRRTEKSLNGVALQTAADLEAFANSFNK